MKKILTLFLLALSTLTAWAEVDPNFHVYICFGQSNMEGNAQWQDIDNQYVDPRFQMLATTNFNDPKRTLGQWYTAKCPIVSPVGKLGMSDYFGRTMVAAMPADVKVGVVAVAMGGSPIEMFDKDKYQQKMKEKEANGDTPYHVMLATNYYGGNPYGRIIDMAKKAQEVGVIKGILLHQGCSNCGDPNWPTEVKKIYNDMLKDLGLKAADVPLFVGETEQADMGGGCSLHNNVVNQMPSVVPTSHVVHSNGIPGNGNDPWHFSAAGYRTFGKRYAIEALKVMGREAQQDASYELPSNLVKFYTLSKLDNSKIQVKAGAKHQVIVWGVFADGHREDLTNEVTVSSTDFTVSNGAIKPMSEGTGIVTVTYTDFTGKQHTADITVEVGSTGITNRFTSPSQLTGKTFAIVNEDEGKAFYCPDNQNLRFDAYDVAFADANVGYNFKIENSTVSGCYLLRLIQHDGTPYVIWGSPGYLNGYSTQTDCSFILGLNNQNGQDVKNGAVWDIKYVDGKGFTMLNKYTGKYLHDALSAKYTDPVYFTFCTVGTTTGITQYPTTITQESKAPVYTLQGVKVATSEQFSDLPRGLYIVNGKKIHKQ